MSRRIPTEIKDVQELGRLVDSELQKLSVEGTKGFVSETQPVDKSRSYLFIDNGVLKFFNATTKNTKTVSLA